MRTQKKNPGLELGKNAGSKCGLGFLMQDTVRHPPFFLQKEKVGAEAFSFQE